MTSSNVVFGSLPFVWMNENMNERRKDGNSVRTYASIILSFKLGTVLVASGFYLYCLGLLDNFWDRKDTAAVEYVSCGASLQRLYCMVS
ncbi:hypothetical protein Nepgr_009798 [Nepenthes gracilis]|uniref:Uncharacterized protein n=1 Tax=Nepenthes gracilis TaxID=150966 RepID=A0AAD3SB65_NEPGR|nr:hypothetical protein Nepgr_009798 [Nepenthes gracilis]